MLPLEFIEELPELVPEFIVLPEVVDEPLPIVLPELVDDGLVVLDDDDGMLPDPVVPVVPMVPGVLRVPMVPVVSVVLVLLDGVVVVLELELDCAIAAPPPINNEAAAMAVVAFKNEFMVVTPDVVETQAHPTATSSRIPMSDAPKRQQPLCPIPAPVRSFVTKC